MRDMKKTNQRKQTNFTLIFLLIPLFVFAKNKSDTLKFVHLTDIHLILNPISYDSNFVQRRYNHFWDDKEPFVNFLHTNSALKESDFLVISGDMIDFYEAESSEGGLLGNQIELFQRLMDKEYNSHLYLTLGNHDITSYPKGRYHQNNAHIARTTWTKNSPSFRNGTYYSVQYQVGETTYRLIFLDNAYFSVKTEKEQASFIIDRPQLDWLKEQLNESPDDKEIIFMHMPLPILKEMREDSSLDYAEYTQRTRTEEFLNILKNTENASIQLIIAGHEHKSEESNFDFSEDFKLKQIKTGAFGNSVDNWRLFQLTESEIIVSTPGTLDQISKIMLK